jgi:flagellar biosynthesis/type III secretory pathway protein FliH
MSSCERVLRRTAVSPRNYLIGDAVRGAPNPIDTRPLTVQEAEERFTREIARLKDQHQAALEEAYRNGYQDGAGMAGAKAAADTARIAAILDSIGDEFARTRTGWYDACEQQIIELIGCALEKILGDRPALPERVAHSLREAFDRLAGGDRVTLRCHPQDLVFVQELLSKKLDEFSGFRQIRVLPDEQVGPNGCLVETDLGVVDARIEQQLAILKGVLGTALRDRPAPAVHDAAEPAETLDDTPPG